MRADPNLFTCRLCGFEHAPMRLARRRRALCIRCGATLARRSLLGPEAATAFAATGAILLIPSLLLPFATVSRVGPSRATSLLEGAGALWDHDMPALAGWVILCGLLAPALLLLGLLGAMINGDSSRSETSGWSKLVHTIEAWSMPEVYVLSVLVALVRVHVLADVAIGAGFWCYAAMSVLLMMAWRNFTLEPRPVREERA
jgi:paraquat-inducible protein A